MEIIPLTQQKADVHRFLAVSEELYRKDPFWVAPIRDDLQKVFLPQNPLFEHAEMQCWVLRDGDRDVGRITGVIDRLYHEHHDPGTAFFGFFESTNDPQVAARLIETVEDWAHRKGMKHLLGPMNPTSNDECGLLVKGYDSSPVLMMPYNPPYYETLITGLGFKKQKDLLAYYIDLAKTPMERFEKIANRFRKHHPDIRFRPVRRGTIQQDITKIKEVYNSAWEANWGFTPMTDPELDFLASRLKPMLAEGLVWLAETDAETVGFLLALPDYNQPMKPLKGRLLTPKILGFIPYLLGWKSPDLCRVIVLGVKQAFRKRGIEAVLLHEGLKTGFKLGFRGAEASWVLEENTQVQQVIKMFGAEPYKVYRLFDKPIDLDRQK